MRDVAEFALFRYDNEARMSREVEDLRKLGFEFDLEKKIVVSNESNILQNIAVLARAAITPLTEDLFYSITDRFGLFADIIALMDISIAVISITSIFCLIVIVYLSKAQATF